MALFSRPKLFSNPLKKRDIPKGLYHKCPLSGEMIYARELEENLMVVPQSGYHFPIHPDARLRHLLDEDSFTVLDEDLESVDALKFQGVASYEEKLTQHQKKSGVKDAVYSGLGAIETIPVSIAVMDFRFLGASMGSVVGEKITRTIERAEERKIPCIVISTSGGARMYEGILSLMQMAKTSAALARLRAAGLPYISILTNPTTAGVMASYASLGDVILAEPRALIGFAGPRVIKETTQQALPEGFQTAEFLLEHGLVDQIVSRLEMRARLASLLKALYRPPVTPAAQEA